MNGAWKENRGKKRDESEKANRTITASGFQGEVSEGR